VELIDILGNNKGDDNRVNREETLTLANKAKDLESGPGKLWYGHITPRRVTEIQKNYHRLTDQTALNLLEPRYHSIGGDPRTSYLIKDRTLDSIFSC
jgi:hypothetical protein